MGNGQSRKTNPRLLKDDICSYIAKNTTLTKAQVKDVFDCYSDLIIEIIKTDKRQDGFTIPLPNIGTFSFRKVNGYKKGTVIKMPNPNDNFNSSMDIIINEDKPNYQRLFLKVNKNVQDLLREVSSTYE